MFTKEKTNVCKGVGVLFLLFHHMFMSLTATQHMVLWISDPVVLANIAVGMRVCVWIFAFLSAYGLTYKYMRLSREQRHWFVPRQWLSLMKPFWLVFALTVIFYLIMFQNLMGVYQDNVLYLFFDIFAVSDFMGTPKLLGVFWYMCFAQLMIFLIPLLIKLCEKMGYLSILLAFITLQFINDGIVTHNGGSYSEYLIVVVCGVVFAQKDLLNRLAAQKIHLALRISLCIVLAAVAVGSVCLNQMVILDNRLHLRGAFSAISAIAVCVLFGVYLDVKWLSKALAFLGKYSGLMFLVHSVLNNFTPYLIFVSNIAAVDFLIFVGLSLMISFLIDRLRALIRYDKWFEGLIALGKKSGAKILTKAA